MYIYIDKHKANDKCLHLSHQQYYISGGIKLKSIE